jgi:methionine synthase / methylenetetrahydrofolate reductase(NADPH)
LQAGAEILETNTFGANRFRLARHGLAGKWPRSTPPACAGAPGVEHLKKSRPGEAWVAGSVGPLGVRLEPLGKTGLDEARAAFAEQIRAFWPRAGVDLLIIETMPALNEAREALAAREVLPICPCW